MNLRSAAFWGRDLLSGGRVRAELRDVEFLNSRSPEATKRRVELLEEHLDYVTSRVPYYRRLTGSTSLTDFPVLSKENIRSNQSGMIADGFDLAKLHIASTSGSTGIPFRVYQNREKRQRVDAEAIHFGRLSGYHIGNPLWHLKVWTPRNSRSRISAFARNMHPVDVSTFNEKEARALIDTIQRRKGSSSVIAYSSSLETIARLFRDEEQGSRRDEGIVSIVGQSEPLSQEARNILGRTLGTYPVGRYGLEEIGVVGQQQTSLDGSYRMNLASHIVEVLRQESNDRASAGEIGRLVVTDLFNKAQPMLRYDTGDLAIVGSDEDGTGFVESLVRLDGRSRERLYDVDDKPLAPMIAYNFWWKFPEILQYQIIQRGRGHYVLRLDVDAGFDQEPEMAEELRRQVGQSARIDVEYGASNYRHASGKRRPIVSEYVPSSVSE